uniref:Uncharacterized protein n=1 Tax=Romanomermis culicivorax TaxID=13658 RepID=A0A915K4A0_ROMCU
MDGRCSKMIANRAQQILGILANIDCPYSAQKKPELHHRTIYSYYRSKYIDICRKRIPSFTTNKIFRDDTNILFGGNSLAFGPNTIS